MKNLLFLFILNISFLNAQTYNFNYLISYSIESLPDCHSESVMYVNTKNDNYYIVLKKSQDILTAKLTDYQSKKIHYFTVKETKHKREVLFDFQYDYSTDSNYLNPSKVFKNEYSFTKDSVSLDSDVGNLELQVYKNSKRKKLERKFSVEVKKSENLFSAFEYCCIHPHQFNQLEKPKSLLVIKATETTKKGQLINYELKILKKVNFQLVVPKESEMKSNNSLH